MATGKKRTDAELREIAIGATRSYMRSMGIDPATRSEIDALKSLDDLGRMNDGRLAGQFARTASDSQIELFKRDWRKWRSRQNTGG